MNLTGQLIFREAGRRSGKRLMMVVGIVATEDPMISGEMQCVITGESDGEKLKAEILLPGKDVSEETMYNKLGDLLLKPLWRV